MGAVSRSKWCAVSTSRNSASSRTTLTNKRCLPRCRLWHLSDYTHTDFTHGKIYRHPDCKRALYRLIDARVTRPIQRAKTPDSLCYMPCGKGSFRAKHVQCSCFRPIQPGCTNLGGCSQASSGRKQPALRHAAQHC